MFRLFAFTISSGHPAKFLKWSSKSFKNTENKKGDKFSEQRSNKYHCYIVVGLNDSRSSQHPRQQHQNH
jgi:hypothetical protein